MLSVDLPFTELPTRLWYTYAEVATMFGVTHQTVRLWVSRGRVPYRVINLRGRAVRVIGQPDLCTLYEDVVSLPKNLRESDPRARALAWRARRTAKSNAVQRAKRKAASTTEAASTTADPEPDPTGESDL